MRRRLTLYYPFHPLFGQRDDLEVIEVRSDMLVARLPDGSRRGIPAWMFDPAVCDKVLKVSRPLVEAHTLLEIAHLLELNRAMSVSELKCAVDVLSVEDRLELADYLRRTSKENDPQWQAEVGRRLDACLAGSDHKADETITLHDRLSADGR